MGFLSTPQRVLHDKDANSTFRKSPIRFPKKMRNNETRKTVAFSGYPPKKANMTMENLLIEDGVPIENRDFLQCHVSELRELSG